MVSMYYVGWGVGGGILSPTISLRLGGWRIGEIYVSVCKFSSPLLSQKRSYKKNVSNPKNGSNKTQRYSRPINKNQISKV